MEVFPPAVKTASVWNLFVGPDLRIRVDFLDRPDGRDRASGVHRQPRGCLLHLAACHPHPGAGLDAIAMGIIFALALHFTAVRLTGLGADALLHRLRQASVVVLLVTAALVLGLVVFRLWPRPLQYSSSGASVFSLRGSVRARGGFCGRSPQGLEPSTVGGTFRRPSCVPSPLDVECNDVLGVVPQPGWRIAKRLLVGLGDRLIPWRHRSGLSAPRRGRRNPDCNYRVAEAHPGRGSEAAVGGGILIWAILTFPVVGLGLVLLPFQRVSFRRLEAMADQRGSRSGCGSLRAAHEGLAPNAGRVVP